MLSLSQTTGYAILALGCLDEPDGERALERDIAEKTGIAKPYLSKLMHRLSQYGLIDGKRGHKGGVRLSRPAKDISMLEVAEAVEGIEWRAKCFLGMPTCGEGSPCPMHEFWLKARPKLEKKLTDLTLAHVKKHTDDGWRL